MEADIRITTGTVPWQRPFPETVGLGEGETAGVRKWQTNVQTIIVARLTPLFSVFMFCHPIDWEETSPPRTKPIFMVLKRPFLGGHTKMIYPRAHMS